MRHSSGRGQVEPFAALAAVLAVSAALVIYVGALDDAVPAEPESETPATIHHRVDRVLSATGVADPDRLDTAMSQVPAGWNANVTLAAGEERWTRGEAPPESATRVTGRVSVGLGPKHVRPGQLRVMVWR